MRAGLLRWTSVGNLNFHRVLRSGHFPRQGARGPAPEAVRYPAQHMETSKNLRADAV
jgi:hypothetical protein